MTIRIVQGVSKRVAWLEKHGIEIDQTNPRLQAILKRNEMFKKYEVVRQMHDGRVHYLLSAYCTVVAKKRLGRVDDCTVYKTAHGWLLLYSTPNGVKLPRFAVCDKIFTGENTCYFRALTNEESDSVCCDELKCIRKVLCSKKG